MIKEVKNRIPFLQYFSRRRKLKRFGKKYTIWKKQGAQLPMPHYGKQLALEEYIVRFEPEVFIETGTYTGHMVLSMLDKFYKLYSIELDKVLYQKAVETFHGYKHVHILQGGSDIILGDLLRNVDAPCLFWLDAHYSGGSTAKADIETPIIKELEHILNHPLADRHILLIDDARCFDGTNDYPDIKVLENLIHQSFSDWHFEVKDDIIRTYSKNFTIPENRY
ncbi:MAG: hypothetical protein KAR20_02460 [Candidatus Heimdallarchaeota archaeon]|nr:hypothetical protein [Candidatus Heimdallarchaeota archaeon]